MRLFSFANTRQNKRAEEGRLPFPAAARDRIAVLGSYSCFAGTSVFLEDRWDALEQFAPEVIAGDRTALARIAGEIFQGARNLGSVNTVVFCLTPFGTAPLAPAIRTQLWRAFEVPVYDLLIDPELGVLAGECEAHEGWHIRSTQLRYDSRTKHLSLPARPQTGVMTAASLDTICACGDAAPLLRGARAGALQHLTKAVGA